MKTILKLSAYGLRIDSGVVTYAVFTFEKSSSMKYYVTVDKK